MAFLRGLWLLTLGAKGRAEGLRGMELLSKTVTNLFHLIQPFLGANWRGESPVKTGNVGAPQGPRAPGCGGPEPTAFREEGGGPGQAAPQPSAVSEEQGGDAAVQTWPCVRAEAADGHRAAPAAAQSAGRERMLTSQAAGEARGRPPSLGPGFRAGKNSTARASLVAQWLRVCLPMQGTRVRALVWEDPTCCGATGPVSHNY